MRYWLVKSDFEDYSISDFKKDKKTLWTGVRNYQARNYMTQGMDVGDMVLFYHSNASPGIAGVGKVSQKAMPDPSQFDTTDSHFDPKASKEKPMWFAVELTFVSEYTSTIGLDILRKTKGLEKMVILKPGNRLSVTPVTEKEYKTIEKLSEHAYT